jgi:hypothetical protein
MNELAANGMSADLDQRMNNYMVKIRTTSEEMKGRRTPLTQFLTKITKAFTSLENQLDKDDPYPRFPQRFRKPGMSLPGS